MSLESARYQRGCLAQRHFLKRLDEVGLAFVLLRKPCIRLCVSLVLLVKPGDSNYYEPGRSLANPLDLEAQLMGLYRVELQEDCRACHQQLGRKRAVVITGPDNMDRSNIWNQYLPSLEDGKISQHTLTYEDLGMDKVELSENSWWRC